MTEKIKNMDSTISLLPEEEMEDYMLGLIEREEEQLIKVTHLMFLMALNPAYLKPVINASELLLNIVEYELDLYHQLPIDFYNTAEEKDRVIAALQKKTKDIKTSIRKYKKLMS